MPPTPSTTSFYETQLDIGDYGPRAGQILVDNQAEPSSPARAVRASSRFPSDQWQVSRSPAGNNYKALTEDYKRARWGDRVHERLSRKLAPSEVVDLMRQILIDGIPASKARPVTGILTASAEFSSHRGASYKQALIDAGLLDYIEMERALMVEPLVVREVREQEFETRNGHVRLSREYIENKYGTEIYRDHVTDSKKPYKSVSLVADAMWEIVKNGVPSRQTTPRTGVILNARGEFFLGDKRSQAYERMLRNFVLPQNRHLTLLDYYNEEKSTLTDSVDPARIVTLTQEKVADILNLLDQGHSKNDVASMLNVTEHSITHYFSGRDFTAYGAAIEEGAHAKLDLATKMERLVQAHEMFNNTDLSIIEIESRTPGLRIPRYFKHRSFDGTLPAVKNLKNAIENEEDEEQRWIWLTQLREMGYQSTTAAADSDEEEDEYRRQAGGSD